MRSAKRKPSCASPLLRLGVLNQHEQQTAGVLQGLSDTLGAARAGDARQGDAGESRAPTTPLVLERGAIALDDYESGAEVLYKAWYVPMPAACLDVDA